MSKVLRIPTSDYKIIVGEGNTITLDTTNGRNNGAGTVIITGDLEVKGDTTTVSSTEIELSDNILILNAGNPGNGLPASLDRPYSSGIEIDRGGFTDARWVYDDSITWSLGTGTSGVGTWLAEQGSTRLPLATPGIVAGGNFYVSVGNGVISVEGSNLYEEKVFRYDGGLLTPDPITGSVIENDDAIPNAKAVADFVDYSFVNIGISSITQDNSSVAVLDKKNVIAAVIEVGSTTTLRTVNSHGYLSGETIEISGVTSSPSDSFIDSINGTHTIVATPTETTIEISLSTTGGNISNYVLNSGATVVQSVDETRVAITIENDNVANFYENRLELYDIKIQGSEISTTFSDADLKIAAVGTGSVVVKDVLQITETPNEDDGSLDPTAPEEGIKIYSKTEGTGKSGLYIVNANNTSDEIISKNRALLFSMLF